MPNPQHIQHLHYIYGGIYTLLWDNTPISLGIYTNATHITHITWDKKLLNKSHKTPLSDECALQIQAYFDKKLLYFDLPLLPQGSAFQMRVWEALRQIPYGEKRSYKDIARAIHNPNASRAVGNANNANPLMILIPCHRVVRENGDIGGYALDIFKNAMGIKAKLLELESSPKY
ncbi:putative methylated-DNA-protein-cysteine methyltransferase [Helicobacter cinaedi PAGU611]|uniref:methylated-DNA--[protein]-cysteine S-methyltransferase n=1 Tax=Helicobacter cinaedi TaxID=213 RepID=UPI00025D335E|nr:methylated-DNA--[protein]-cysteine S-methyltransferase [Helicobacter cinaedi]BAM15027.1 putative methylated-DNA-protein-cysteine methyltransferase [Helicobacter cinaedi PAGU611]BBB19879.1 methylated-DNA--protein-cysteine methyltransferase [Helicobacter cinaedi]